MKAYVIDFIKTPRFGPELVDELGRFGISAAVIDAVDGRNPVNITFVLDHERFRKKRRGRTMVPGEIGCFGSHVNLCRGFVDGSVEPAHRDWLLVFEDDAMPRRGFNAEYIASMIDMADGLGAQFLNLGPKVDRPLPRETEERPMGLLAPDKECFRTHCVAYSMEGARTIAATGIMDEPYDDYMLTLFRESNRYALVCGSPKIWFKASSQSITTERRKARAIV